MKRQLANRIGLSHSQCSFYCSIQFDLSLGSRVVGDGRGTLLSAEKATTTSTTYKYVRTNELCTDRCDLEISHSLLNRTHIKNVGPDIVWFEFNRIVAFLCCFPLPNARAPARSAHINATKQYDDRVFRMEMGIASTSFCGFCILRQFGKFSQIFWFDKIIIFVLSSNVVSRDYFNRKVSVWIWTTVPMPSTTTTTTNLCKVWIVKMKRTHSGSLVWIGSIVVMVMQNDVDGNRMAHGLNVKNHKFYLSPKQCVKFPRWTEHIWIVSVGKLNAFAQLIDVDCH